MYEVASCGTTIDIVADLFSASTTYDHCNGPEVVLYKYDGQGNKRIIQSKQNNMRIMHSKAVTPNQRNGV